MAALPNKSCHEMEGDQNQTPTEVFQEDLMDVMPLDHEGMQSLLPSSLEGFQAPSSRYTLLDMDLTGSLDFRPPISPISSSSQPLIGVTGCMDTLTLQQWSEMTRKQYQSLQDTFFTEIGQLKYAVDTFTLNADTASVKQTAEVKQLMSNQFEHFRKEFNNMLHWRLKNHHIEVLKDFNAVLEPMAKTLNLIEKATDQCTHQINTFISQTSSNSNLQDELHQCTQHFHKLSLDLGALKSSQMSSVKANASVQTSMSPSSSTVVEAPVVNTRLQQFHSTFQYGPGDSAFNSTNESVTAEGRGRFMGKQPIKIQFPCFGRLDDCDDPLNFLEKCYDFMALHPLSDEELIATLRNVLHGTARDWWDVARLETTTWQEFESKFLAAFLSEDYEDELAERVRTRVQQEGESIRDFAYMYRALCKRWKPHIAEDEVIKLILKNINPQMASQLRSNGVTSVDTLVRLGQQLEKDRENQLQYEQRKKPWKLKVTSPVFVQGNNPVTTPAQDSKAPFCWRCKGPHSPASCPQSGKNKNYKGQQSSNPVKGNQGNHPTVNAVTHMESVCSPPHPLYSSLPSQLIVPVNIDSWQGQALVDTGSSYTLLNEKLWITMGYQTQQLRPWTEGPIYLADGGARQPLGWGEVQLKVQTLIITSPVVVLAPQMLAFPVVLGLDYIFFSGLQMDIRNNVYWFQPNQTYCFLKNDAHFHDWDNSSPLALFSALPPATLTKESNHLHVACQNTCLEEGGKEHFLTLLKQNAGVCTDVLGKTNVLTHRIYITQAVPIKQKPYRVSPTKQKIIQQLIDEMLAADVIEPSSSAWASPVILIPKKTGGYRFCVDYRKVNSVSQSDAYPLPTIQEILESLSGAVVFSTLDLNSGYWQVRMEEDSQDKTAFTCGQGLFHFKVMAFGLKNAPATFQRLMERVLGELQGKNCFVYLDDIIIYSPSMEQHFQDIQAVLNKLKEAHLTVNMKKTHFFRTSLKFLGHIVTATGIKADPEKTRAVQEFPVPKNIKEVQRFLGMAGWYHRFVPHFSQVAEPLNALKRKGAKFLWTSQCQASFQALKLLLVSSPVLGHPNLKLPFIVYTDASEVGLGAVLVQQTGLGTEEVLAFASRTLNPAERNYTTTEQECLAVVWALEKWRYYLDGKFFTVITDHSSLMWVFKTQKPNTRLIRWALRLQEFNFTVEYRKGKYNTVPDALSRAPVDINEHGLLTCSTALSLKSKGKSEAMEDLPITDYDIWKAQQTDPDIHHLYEQMVESGEIPVNSSVKFSILEDKVYRVVQFPHKIVYQVYIPKTLRSQILQSLYEDPLAGHLGRFKTFKRLQVLVYWPNLNQDVKEFVQNCHICQRYKPECRRLPGPLQQTIVQRPWEMLGVDLMGPFPRSSSGNVFLLVFVDYYSRWVELFSLRKATSETVSQILIREVLTRWGVPDYILSDRGSQFTSSVFQELCKNWNIIHKMTTAYHPQTNLTERINRTLKTMVASYVSDNHKHWDKFIPEFRFALNSAVHESTGVTPAELNLNRSLRGPLDVLLQPRDVSPEESCYDKLKELNQMKEYVEKRLYTARKRQKRNYDKNRREVVFEERDRVWMRTHPYSKAEKFFSAKIAPKWQGPYRIVQRLGPLNYEIVLEDNGEDKRVVHVSRLKPCFPSAKELEAQQQRQLLHCFNEDSDEEEFLGFTEENM